MVPAYFERLDAFAFRATDAVQGAWSTDEQHIAPALGLLAHAIEQDHHARRATEVAFPNVDITCHLIAQPEGEWIGFDTTVTVGPVGLGLTDTVLHDARGPIGTVQQILTIRPM